MKPIRVVVIDDSAFMRKMISDILESDSRIEVVGTARNGKLGIERVKELSPDVVTMDVNMPVMDGFTALEKIMKSNPVPVIIITGDSTDGADKTIYSMESGAVDFIKKPSGPISLNIEDIKDEIISKVITASQTDISRYRPVKSSRLERETSRENEQLTARERPTARQLKTTSRTFIALGTSTGGPRALQKVLTDLPADFTAPIFIVQHMPKGFTKSLADRLDNLSALEVREAVHGELVREGTAYLAPGDFHMRVVKEGATYKIHLSNDAPVFGHRPSVDVLFESIAKLNQVEKIAVILTGMGSDGTNGIAEMKRTDPKVKVIAETEDTSVVYGMPKAAFESGNVDLTLPLDEVGNKLQDLTM